MSISPIDRRQFLAECGTMGSVVLLPGRVSWAQSADSSRAPAFPQQDPDRVRRMVGVSHGNLEAVRELLAEDHELARATWDWGFGDWETALGAASHTGSRKIALLLLEHGARMDLFCAAMLGKLNVLRAAIEAQPGIQRTRGPHSLTLLHHAQTGGDAAKHVVRYLESVGDADLAPQPVTLSEDEFARLIGAYRAETPAPVTMYIETHEARSGLWLRCGDRNIRQLYRKDRPGEYHPAGAESVHMSFMRDARGIANRLTIRWPGGREVNAARIAE